MNDIPPLSHAERLHRSRSSMKYWMERQSETIKQLKDVGVETGRNELSHIQIRHKDEEIATMLRLALTFMHTETEIRYHLKRVNDLSGESNSILKMMEDGSI